VKIVSFVSLLSILILSCHFTNFLLLSFYKRYKLGKVSWAGVHFPYSGSYPINGCGDDGVGGQSCRNKISFVQFL